MDVALVGARAGDARSFEVLYRALHPRLCRYLGAITRDDVDDLASETWLAASRGLDRFEGDADDFTGWLFTIARHRVVDEARRRRRRPVTAAGDPDDVVVLSSAEDAALETGRLGDEAARRLVAGLSPDLAEIVLLRTVAGLSVDQVAAITGRRPGTVRVMQHRALKRLADTLGDRRL